MKAVCVTPKRELEVRDAPVPGAPPEGHVVIKMEACAINHGDHTFLKLRSLMNMPATLHDIWGRLARAASLRSEQACRRIIWERKSRSIAPCR
jgi:threonine dehydrogenase-like Zn-dependent dehydrogenase